MRRARRLLRLLLLLPAIFLFSSPAHATNEAAHGWCENGNQQVNLSGLLSTSLAQASYPQCTVTVYVHGGGIAIIYADAANTPLANPFTAATNGQWIWYAADGRYDVTMSGGTGGGFTAPVTYSDILLNTSGGGGGGTPCTVTALSIQFNNAGSFGCTLMTYTAGSATLTSGLITADFSGATAVKVPVTATRVIYAGTGGAVQGDPLFIYRTANTVLSVSPLFASFSATAQSIFNNPQTSTGYGFMAGRLCTTTNCSGAAGVFQTEGDNVDGVQAIGINHSTILGDAGGDVNGAEFFGYYYTTVSTLRGAVGNGTYASVTADAGHTSGGAVGIIGQAGNYGAGGIVDSALYPLASFITYGNDNYCMTATCLPRNFGYEANHDFGTYANGGGTAPTLGAAFHAVAQTGYVAYWEGGASHEGVIAGDFATPVNADHWYNSSTNKFRCRENGATVNCIGSGGGGGTPCTTTALSFQFNDGGSFGCVPMTYTAGSTTVALSTGTLFDASAGGDFRARVISSGLSPLNTGSFAYRTDVSTWAFNVAGTSQFPAWLGINNTWTADQTFAALSATAVTSQTANLATAGFIRMAKTDLIEWRNNANGANLTLGINGSDLLYFNGSTLPITKAAITSQWLRSYDQTTGLFTSSQPSISDITATISAPLTLTTNTLACATCATASGLTTNRLPKIGTSPALADSLLSDDGTTATYTGTGGVSAPKITSTGSNAGALVLTQGTAQGHATANTLTFEAAAAVTAYEIVMPGAAATGLMQFTNAANVDTAAFVPLAFSTQTDAATVTWALGGAMVANATVTLGGNRTLAITNPVNGGSYVLKVVQDGTGSRTLTLGSGCTWKVSGGGAGAITLSTGAAAIDILAFTYDGTNCYANLNNNFS